MKDGNISNIVPIFAMSLLFPLVYFFSLMIIKPFQEAGVRAFENPENPMNIAYFLLILLIITVFILLIARYWKKKAIYVFILAAVGITGIYVLDPSLSIFIEEPFAFIISAFIVASMILLLIYYPEWYVIDASGILLATGSIAIFGISLTVPLVIILLIFLAIYDAISVYKTKHMIELADTVVDLKLPILFVIPKKLSYSFRKASLNIKKEEEKDAFFMGVGDVVMPGVLVASCYNFIGNYIISIAVMAGILIGFLFLMILVVKGRPQPGLPFLNTGAILGYLISSYILYHNFTF